MHQDPEHEDYDDDEYNYYPSYNDYGYPELSKKFSIDWAAWEKWLSDTIKEITQDNSGVLFVGSHLSKNNKKSTNSNFMYLGKNNYDETIWKTKYFNQNKLEIQYKNHLAQYAAYFLNQPQYYRALFENLN